MTAQPEWDGTDRRHDLRAELEAVRLELARLSGSVEALVATVNATAAAQSGLETRIRACELQCAGCVSARETEKRPPQWPAIVAAIVATVVLLWQIAQQVGGMKAG